MAYSLSNIYSKNCWKQTTTVKIIVGSWVVYFWDTLYMYLTACYHRVRKQCKL